MKKRTRLIDANAFSIQLIYVAAEALRYKKYARYHAVMEAVNMLDNAPTESGDVMRHGRWIPKETMVKRPYARNYYCSECHDEPLETGKWCKECGARMDG